jgi:hypothetical protein
MAVRRRWTCTDRSRHERRSRHQALPVGRSPPREACDGRRVRPRRATAPAPRPVHHPAPAHGPRRAQRHIPWRSWRPLDVRILRSNIGIEREFTVLEAPTDVGDRRPRVTWIRAARIGEPGHSASHATNAAFRTRGRSAFRRPPRGSTRRPRQATRRTGTDPQGGARGRREGSRDQPATRLREEGEPSPADGRARPSGRQTSHTGNRRRRRRPTPLLPPRRTRPAMNRRRMASASPSASAVTAPMNALNVGKRSIISRPALGDPSAPDVPRRAARSANSLSAEPRRTQARRTRTRPAAWLPRRIREACP